MEDYTLAATAHEKAEAAAAAEPIHPAALTAIQSDLSALKTNVAETKTDLKETETRVGGLEHLAAIHFKGITQTLQALSRPPAFTALLTKTPTLPGHLAIYPSMAALIPG